MQDGRIVHPSIALSSSDHASTSAAAMSLPQYGFSTDVEFTKLIENNHFLFRVYTPKAPSPFDDNSEPFLVAPKFNERFAQSPQEIRGSFFGHDSAPCSGTYGDVVRHMDWSTKSTSAYVSTSFSFIWSIWEALRRYHQGVKKDIEIAVIDANAVSEKAATAVQLLQASSASGRRAEHWKWYRYAQESQCVLVHEFIPTSAILASIPLVSLLDKLPSYFLRHDEPSASSALAGIGWDYGEKKQNFRRFCQEMSNRFLQSTPEKRLEDTTAGSVRLAIAFLRPWFRRCVVDDFQAATVTLCALSFNIAQWPGQWWAQEHSELWDLIRAMVLSLAEEIREAEGGHKSKVVQLREVITNLEDAVERYRSEISERQTRRKSALLLTPLLIPPPMWPAPLPAASPLSRLTLPTAAAEPTTRTPVTPITPPTSPIRSRIHHKSITLEGKYTQEIPVISSPSPSAKSFTDIDIFVESPSSTAIDSLDTPTSPSTARIPFNLISTVHPTDVVLDKSITNRSVARKAPTIAETASCIATGFLVGAFITLCFLSPQRRMLLTHLT